MLSSPLKDGRRVLGDKTTNASSKPRSTQGSTMGSPMKPCRDSPAPIVFSPRSHAGQKRSIDQLEASPDVSGPVNAPLATSQRGVGFHVFAEGIQATMDSEKNKSASATVVATEPNTPDPESPIALTYEDDKTNEHSPTLKSSVPTDPDARKVFIQQKAGLLRTRLQSAAKKSDSNHIDRRLLALEAHSRNRKYTPTALPTSSYLTSIARDSNLTPKAKAPRLLPAPDLRPTPYSARYTTGILPSSPPASSGSAKRVEEDTDDMMTPVQSRPRLHPKTPTYPVQLSSPPGSTGTQAKATPEIVVTSEQKGRSEQVEKMIAHAKKIDQGDAASGLLKLMKTGEERDNMDESTG